MLQPSLLHQSHEGLLQLVRRTIHPHVVQSEGLEQHVSVQLLWPEEAISQLPTSTTVAVVPMVTLNWELTDVLVKRRAIFLTTRYWTPVPRSTLRMVR